MEGRAAIPGFLASFPTFSDLTVTRVAVEGMGDLAFVHRKYTMTMMGTPDSGKFLETWKRGADGSWKIHRDMFNSDIALPAPPPARK